MYKLNLFERKAYPISSLMPFGMIVGGGLLDVNGRKEKQAAVVINKNGSLMTTWKYRGPDLESSVPEQTAVVTAQLNGILMTLGTGYTLYLDAQRSPSTQYARDVYFPDPVTRAIDAQRRLKFSSGEFFESNYYLTLCWIPPSDQEGRMKEFVMEGHKQKAAELDENMEMFTETAFRLYRTMEDTDRPLGQGRDGDVSALLRIVQELCDPGTERTAACGFVFIRRLFAWRQRSKAGEKVYEGHCPESLSELQPVRHAQRSQS